MKIQTEKVTEVHQLFYHKVHLCSHEFKFAKYSHFLQKSLTLNTPNTLHDSPNSGHRIHPEVTNLSASRYINLEHITCFKRNSYFVYVKIPGNFLSSLEVNGLTQRDIFKDRSDPANSKYLFRRDQMGVILHVSLI